MQEAHIFCISVEKWPKWAVLILVIPGIFTSFLLQGLAHEQLYETFKFKETMFLTFLQFIGYASLSLPYVFKIIIGKAPLKAKFYLYLITSMSLVLTMSLGNFASLRLSYATSVLFKSSKLIPVMIGNVVLLKKTPKLTEIISGLLIVAGLIGISIGDMKGKNKFDTLGLIAVSLALSFDAIASNLEDKLMSVYGSSQDEVITLLYGLGSMITGIIALVTGDMKNGIARVYEQPTSILYIALFAFLGAIGVQFVYLTMKVFGSLFTVMVTSVRKAFTVCLSFIVFPKNFTAYHGAAIISLVTGMTLNIHEKIKKQLPQDESKLLSDEQVEITSSKFEENISEETEEYTIEQGSSSEP